MEWLIAHGLVGRSDLPIPEWLFGWAAAIVLIVSFVALAVLWPEPKLEGDRGWRRLFALPQLPVDIVCGAIGVFLFGVTIWAGFAGEQTAAANWASTFVYVIFWLGFAAGERAVRATSSAPSTPGARSRAPWPALAKLADRRQPAGAAAVSGAPRPLAGRRGDLRVRVHGARRDERRHAAEHRRSRPSSTRRRPGSRWRSTGSSRWIERGEAFSVYFNLFSRISVWERRGRDVGLRRPLSGLAALESAARHGAAPGRDDRLGHLRRRGRGQAVGRHRARHVGLLPAISGSRPRTR